MRDASRRETGRLQRGARPLSSQKATQIAREGETPSQAGPPIRDLLREVFPTLAGQWAVGAGDPPQHTIGRFGREAVDLPVAVVNRSPGGRLSLRRGGGGLVSPLGAQWQEKRATRGQLGAKTGPKVCQTDPRADRNGLAEQVAYRGLAMESHAAETFVNQSFRSSPEGSIAAQLTFGDCVQRGYCRLTVSSFCECRSRGGNERAALEDRSFPTTFADSESFEGVLEGVVDQVGVDLRGGEVPVSEGPFDHQDIAGAAVEVGGEGVPQTVGTDALADARLGRIEEHLGLSAEEAGSFRALMARIRREETEARRIHGEQLAEGVAEN